MELNSSNYFSLEANKEYMSNSQYSGFLECESKELAKLTGEHIEDDKDAFLIGSYVHAWNDGKLDEFKADHPELYKKDKSMYEKYAIAQKMVDTIQNDRFAMFSLGKGKSEVILTAELFGAKWKIMLDRDDEKRWIEIKTTKSIKERYWQYNELTERNEQVNFIEKWNYVRNAAVYAEVERLARCRETWKEAVLLAVSKESIPDKEIISLYNPHVQTDGYVFSQELSQIEANMPRILAVKAGIEKPISCGKCAYCLGKKQLSKLVHWSEI